MKEHFFHKVKIKSGDLMNLGKILVSMVSERFPFFITEGGQWMT